MNWQLGVVLFSSVALVIVRNNHLARYIAVFGLVCALAGWIGSTFLKSK